MRKNVTVRSEGTFYRDIADKMTAAGMPMNHSSIRNYIIKSMGRFVQAINNELKLNLTKDRIMAISQTPAFQDVIINSLRDILDAEENNNNARKN